MLKEFGASFPEFKRVLIDERDMYLTSSLRNAYQPVANEFVPGGRIRKKEIMGIKYLTRPYFTLYNSLIIKHKPIYNQKINLRL